MSINGTLAFVILWIVNALIVFVASVFIQQFGELTAQTQLRNITIV